MKHLKTNCLYCGKDLEAKTTRKVFCSNKCKVYWHRENKDKIKPTENKQIIVTNLTPEPPKTNYTIDTKSSRISDYLKKRRGF